MAGKFHVAMFCSEAAYSERRAFYAAIFGTPSPDGEFNETEALRSYHGCEWDRGDGLLFVLLKNPDQTGPVEQLAHVGFMFYDRAEFDSEVKIRGISADKIADLSGGHKQTFIPAENASSIEWEFAYDARVSNGAP